MKTRIARGTALAIILFGLLVLGSPAWMPLALAKSLSPEQFLNADGTLKLDGSMSGTLDLSGYHVQIDPQHGPVLAPDADANHLQSIATPGNWANIGDGGGNINGPVRAIAVSGTNVYVGGDFSDAANIPQADYIAKWDGAHWSALGSNGAGNGSLNGGVRAIAVSGTDIYVGGDFADVNNNGTTLPAADFVAKWDGGNWSALGSNGAGGGSLNSAVMTIAVGGTNLYAGGYFTDVNNNGTVLNAADYIAKWDGSNWSALGSDGTGNGSLNAVPMAIAVSGSNVYVGGYFTNVNNNGTVLNAADYVAKWDGSNWLPLGSNGSGDGSLGGAVFALAMSGTDLYVGGQFSDVDNNGTPLSAADSIAKWDGANWSTLGSNGSGDGALNNYVTSIIVNGTDLYVGGKFKNVNNNGTPLAAADYIAKWDGVNWSAIGSNGAGDGAIPNESDPVVMAVAVLGTNVLAGGNFYDLNNGSTVLPQADFVAQWNGTNWSSLGTDVNGALLSPSSSSAYVSAIAVLGTDVYVGGRFENLSNHGINIPQADNIAKWDGANWSALGSDPAGDGALHSNVNTIAVSGMDLYVGGAFANAAGIATADYIAKWNGSTWSALGSNGAGNGALNKPVAVIAVSGTILYVGGGFTNAANIPEADYIAKWDGSNWSALGSNGAGDGAVGNWVTDIGVNGSDVYVGGYFADAANIPEADYVAKWNGSSWSALGSNGAGNGALNSIVNALAVDGKNVYVGGNFMNVNNGGTPIPEADYIAKWDGANWSALGSNGAGNGALDTVPWVISVAGKDVYVGGNFTDVAGIAQADYVAKWDGANWSALGGNGAGNGALTNAVAALAVDGSDLLVGGFFSNANNNGTVLKAADYLAAFGLPLKPLYLPLVVK